MQYADTSALRSFCVKKTLQHLLLFQSAVKKGPHIFIQNIVINISFLPNVFKEGTGNVQWLAGMHDTKQTGSVTSYSCQTE